MLSRAEHTDVCVCVCVFIVCVDLSGGYFFLPFYPPSSSVGLKTSGASLSVCVCVRVLVRAP